MIVVLPTNTGFLVGMLPMKRGGENRLRRLNPNGPKTHRHMIRNHWAGIREWIQATRHHPN